MDEKIKQRVRRRIARQNMNVISLYFYLGFFFAAAALIGLLVFDNLLVTAAAKPEYATWLNVQMQSQLKFAFRCLAELFFVLSLSSLSIPLFLLFDHLIDKVKKKIKHRFVKVSS